MKYWTISSSELTEFSSKIWKKTAENATGFEILFYKRSYNIVLEHCCSTTIFLRGHIDGV
jgi:hypothetical protein